MADTLRLRYGVLAKPVLADRDGEVDTNWADNGNHSLTADATHAYSGTKSFKIAATNTGDFTTNYVSLASGNNATFVVGKQYCVVIDSYCVPSLTFKIKTGGVESSAFTSPLDTWTKNVFKFTAATATTAFQIAVVEAGTEPYAMWFELQAITEYVDLTVLAERGMSDPDSFELFPALQHRYLDGTMGDDVQAFRRKIWVDVGVVDAAADRKRILYWMIDSARTVDYLTESNIPMCLEDVGGYENEWKFDCSLMRYYTFALLEPSVRTTFPV